MITVHGAQVLGISSGGYHFNEYNGGKTAVHEIGHYFNLDHPWGPVNDPPGNPTCTLSDQCADTPPYRSPVLRLPKQFPVTQPLQPFCSRYHVAKSHRTMPMIDCMIAFTKDQCTRMMTAITTAADRVGLITSNGCQPPAVLNNDIKVGNILFPS